MDLSFWKKKFGAAVGFWIFVTLAFSQGVDLTKAGAGQKKAGNSRTNGFLNEEDITLKPVTVEEEDIELKIEEISDNAKLVNGSEDYPVTAGDVYRLSFIKDGNGVSYSLTVDNEYKIRVAELAVLNTRGMLYPELKKNVEDIVNMNYSLSGVQFSLVSPGMFTVPVTGEVKETVIKTSWAFTRLSEIILGTLTEFSSRRDISIINASGKETHYDLFLYERNGDLSQNPFLSPGDLVVVHESLKKVTVLGSIERPGTYELKEGETLTDLFNVYGGGFTSFADLNRVEVHRYNEDNLKTNVYYLDKENLKVPFVLTDKDAVYVTSVQDMEPCMFIEGAILPKGTEKIKDKETGAVMDRLLVRFDFNMNYASLIRMYQGIFLSSADTEKVYVIRNGERISLDARRMLYDSTYFSDLTVEPFDVLRIPFRQFYITVGGAVKTPGRYEYIPDRSYEYYVNLAGGFIEEMNSGKKVEIYDVGGKKLKNTDKVLPEYTIQVLTNRVDYLSVRETLPWVSILTALATTLTMVVMVVTVLF